MSNKNVFTTVENTLPDRNVFDLTHDIKMSARFGELIPVCAIEAIPSDKFRIGAEGLMRFQPMISPAMHRFDCTIHYFFVANRILWPNWEAFIGPETGVASNAHPTIDIADTIMPRLGDFFGLPTRNATPGSATTVNALPFAAYQKIFADYYRDENLQTGALYEFTPLVDGTNSSATYLTMRYRAWEHDYFTSCLPFAQKGSAVEIPLGTIELDPNWTGTPKFQDDSNPGISGTGAVSQTFTGGAYQIEVAGGAGIKQAYNPDGSLIVGSTTINELRRSYALQAWLEKNARGGTRYVELLKMHFGVRSSDARLQRAEYITGVKSPIVISEVLNTTGDAGGLPQGNMSGHAVSTVGGQGRSFYCEEHGWIIGILSVMPKTAYQEGIHKKFLRRDPLDYPWPSFAHIGEQEVTSQEVFYDASFNTNAGQNADTFGYLPRYSEYRFEQNRVATDLRSTLNSWHAGRIFGGIPTLSAAFITTEGSAGETTDRLFAVSTSVADPIIAHVLNKISVVRPLPYFGTPSY